MNLLKFTQEMYLLVNVKPLDYLKVQNLWIICVLRRGVCLQGICGG
jgi:hypothetical protein